VRISQSPVFRLANLILASLLSVFPLWLFEVSFLHHPSNRFLIEGKKITALIDHPDEGEVGYVTWCVVIVASPYVGMHACEPTLLETSASIGSIDNLFWREVPECWRE